MKIADLPGAMLATPLSATELAKAFELSSMRQPAMLTTLVPVFVTSNQSAPIGLLPLLHGAPSAITSEHWVGGCSTTSVNARLKAAVASGVAPTVESSTATVTL